MRSRVRAVIAAATLLVAVPAVGAVQAQEVQETPAPPGKAEAVAAEVEGVAAIGHTSATADENGGEATGNAVELGGEPPSEEFGGTQTGDGESSGALFDTGENEDGRLQITPWSAAVSSDGGSREAFSSAALARLMFGGIITVNVLQSESRATHDGATSTGSSSSDGATINLGGEEGLDIVVLHAEANSDGSGSTYVLGIEDERILTDEDANGECRLEIPSVLGLVCLTVEGGEGGVDTAVADVTVGGEEGLLATIVGAQGSGTQTGEAVAGVSTQPPPDTSGQRGAQLPVTGGTAASLVGVGILLALGGALALRARRELGAASA